MLNLFLILLLTSWQTHALEFWLTEESEVSHWIDSAPVKKFPASVGSWSLDSKACRLYTASDKGLSRFSREEGAELSGDPITLLERDTSTTLVVSRKGYSFERRNLDGEFLAGIVISPKWRLREAKSLPHETYALMSDAEDSRLDLLAVSTSWELSDVREVVSGTTLWGNPTLERGPKEGELLIGYTRTKPGVSYSPVVEIWKGIGEKLAHYSWNEKGIFLTACRTPDGELVTVRDEPSPGGFTLPVYSLFEKWEGTYPTPYQINDTNWLVESLSCTREGMLTTERSLNGGGYRLTLRSAAGKAIELLKSSSKLLGVAACQ